MHTPIDIRRKEPPPQTTIKTIVKSDESIPRILFAVSTIDPVIVVGSGGGTYTTELLYEYELLVIYLELASPIYLFAMS